MMLFSDIFQSPETTPCWYVHNTHIRIIRNSDIMNASNEHSQQQQQKQINQHDM